MSKHNHMAKTKKMIAKKDQLDKFSEVRESLSKSTADCSPDSVLDRFTKAFAEYEKAPKSKKEEKRLEYTDALRTAMQVVGLDSHFLMAETITEYRTLVIEMTNQLIEEYGCTTASEKSLAQMVAQSYGRFMEYSREFNRSTRIEFLSSQKNGYYGLFSKEVDRAFRQYLSALTTLRQMKSPPMEVHVKAHTAFVAQNQQLNNNSIQEPDKKKYENNAS